MSSANGIDYFSQVPHRSQHHHGLAKFLRGERGTDFANLNQTIFKLRILVKSVFLVFGAPGSVELPLCGPEALKRRDTPPTAVS